jgi:hypothetical protein
MSDGREITYHVAVDLTVPPGVPLKAIVVAIDVKPADGGMLIYGYSSETSILPVEVRGSVPRLELPFIKPKIYIKFRKAFHSYSPLARC